MFDRSLHVRYLGIVDIINLLVFIAATCVYPASYAAQAARVTMHSAGLLDSVVVPPLDEEIDLDDD